MTTIVTPTPAPYGTRRAHGTRAKYVADKCRCDQCRAAFARDRYMPPDPPGVELERTPPPGDWTRAARCHTAPISLFFPERGENADQAKAICAGCPVQPECRQYALDAPGTLQGIWGGLSVKERRRWRLRRRMGGAA